MRSAINFGNKQDISVLEVEKALKDEKLPDTVAKSNSAANSEENKTDGYMAILVGLIPAEISAAYLAIANILGSNIDVSRLYITIVVLMLIIPLYMISSARVF